MNNVEVNANVIKMGDYSKMINDAMENGTLRQRAFAGYMAMLIVESKGICSSNQMIREILNDIDELFKVSETADQIKRNRTK